MKKVIQEIKLRLIILKAGIIYTFQIETAYWANNWGNIISTTIYTLSYLLFIEIIFANVDLVAGFSRDEMLLFTMVSQLWFYAIWTFVMPNVDELVASVNSGSFDLVLTKPLPALFYVLTKKMRIYSILRDGTPPLLAIAITIDWTNIEISFSELMGAIMIFIFGFLISSSIHLMAALPAFFFGQSSELLGVVFETEHNAGHQFPLQGWSSSLQFLLITLLPFGISAGLTTSVLLGKIDFVSVFPIISVTLVLFLSLRSWAWKKALRNYTSASS